MSWIQHLESKMKRSRGMPKPENRVPCVGVAHSETRCINRHGTKIASSFLLSKRGEKLIIHKLPHRQPKIRGEAHNTQGASSVDSGGWRSTRGFLFFFRRNDRVRRIRSKIYIRQEAISHLGKITPAGYNGTIPPPISAIYPDGIKSKLNLYFFPPSTFKKETSCVASFHSD